MITPPVKCSYNVAQNITNWQRKRRRKGTEEKPDLFLRSSADPEDHEIALRLLGMVVFALEFVSSAPDRGCAPLLFDQRKV